ncbi:MAG: HAD hydrolase-like protein [Actinomycetia bacterium]|nr:HAD hydrolase-like protein [Actinomycetes bacterium]
MGGPGRTARGRRAGRGAGGAAPGGAGAPRAAAFPDVVPAPGLRLVALDLDGVVWRGGDVLPGVAEALDQVLRRGLDIRYVSNNSTAHRETVSERLERAGLPAGVDRVLTSGFVTARWLRERLPEGAPVMVIGEEGLLRELREAGLAAYHAGRVDRAPRQSGAATPSGARGAGGQNGVATPSGVAAPAGTPVPAASPATPPGVPPDTPSPGTPPGVPPATARVMLPALVPAAVIVGMDRSFSYQTLAAAQAAIMSGALFVATNCDATFPTPTGLLPGAGSIVAAVATAAGSEPVLMGKPGPALAEVLAAVTGIPAGQTLFVGDRLSTDIAMGRAAGMITALVLTGVTGEEDLRAAERAAAAAAAAAERAAAERAVAEEATAAGTGGAAAAGPVAAGPALPDHVLADLRGLAALVDELRRP